MDPTKSFDHLDPKLKETYARVMGTSPSGPADAAQPIATPTTADPNQTQFDAAPTGIPAQNDGPNPGTGPTINSVPMDTTTTFSPPQEATLAADPNTPTASPFFSNTSPATSEPAQPAPTDNNLTAPMTDAVSEPSTTPITPYSPETLTPTPVTAPTEQYGQPLPSPSSVAQTGPHEASALLRVLYIVGAVIFFAVYTIFWIKIFNLPFLF